MSLGASLYSLSKGDCAALDTHKHRYLASVRGGLFANMLLRSMKGKKLSHMKLHR